MGIRFLCPNGHKLHVKADLAGKRASCPDCGAKLVVPLVSSEDSTVARSGVIARQGADASASQPVGNGQRPPASTATSKTTTARMAAMTTERLLTPRSATWYVRPASGGQFGPADDDTFCQWIAEGRVTADTHVWRDGWPQWRRVRDAADWLPMPLVATPVVAAPAVAAPVASDAPPATVAPSQLDVSISTAPATLPLMQPLVATTTDEPASQAVFADPVALAATQYLVKRQRGRQKQLALAVVMLLAVVVLGVVLILVVRRNENPMSQSFPTRGTYESEAM
jgi:hypothetical protein